MDDGGRVAITGFTLQVLEAILASLSRQDWARVVIEPSSETEEFEKVDIRWILLNGEEEHVQVKHSKNPFSKAQVEAWAISLASGARAARYRLVLLGRASTSVDEARLPARLSTAFNSADVETLADGVAHRIGLYLQRRGTIVTAADARGAVPALAGTLLYGAMSAQEWTPQALGALVGKLTPTFADSLWATAADLEMRLLRLVFIEEFDSVDEYLVVTATNTTTAPFERCFHLYLTDHEACQVLDVSDGGTDDSAPVFQPGTEPTSGAYVLGIKVADPLEPAVPVVFGARFRRVGVAERAGEAWVFRCPLLPTPEPQLAEVVVVFPHHGRVESDGTARTRTSVARWRTTTRNVKRSITATMKPTPVSETTRLADAKLANQYRELARLSLVRPYPLSAIDDLRAEIERGWES